MADWRDDVIHAGHPIGGGAAQAEAILRCHLKYNGLATIQNCDNLHVVLLKRVPR
jgi:hypothetical protein